MSSIRNITPSNIVPVDLANLLGLSGVSIILETFWLAYHDLKADGIISPDYAENMITQEWVIKVTNRWFRENRASRINVYLIPQNQHEDDTMAKSKRKSPSIDFCFRAWNPSEGYFGAECKNLYNNKPDKKRRYVDTGVKHFVSGYYASKSTVSAMIGYILSGDISDAVNCLNPLIAETKPVQNLTREMMVSDPQYKSCHVRTNDSKEIILHHLFFDFVTSRSLPFSLND